MALIKMVMPKMGESIMEGTILNWLKKVGDTIEQDEAVLEVATDKVDTEVPATHGGILKEILAQEGQVVAVGAAIAIIDTEATAETAAQADKVEPAQLLQTDTLPQNEPSITEEQENFIAPAVLQLLDEPLKGRFYSPLVLNIAKEEQVSMEELERIPGTGKENRVTKKDILAYVAGKGAATPTTTAADSAPIAQPADQSAIAESPQTGTKTTSQTVEPELLITPKIENGPVTAPATSVSGNYDIIEMDRMRKVIAQRMLDSKRISPHVTSFVEADVTNLVYWRNRIKHEFMEKHGDVITFTPVFIEAIAKALKDYPMMNISVEGDKILVKKEINIGLAVALANGNLIVPVIKNVDMLNLVGITRKVNELIRKARENKLTADDVSGGTYTISNVGSFGNLMGTPIIVQPQVGIMAFGTIQKKPAVVETPTGDAIAIRQMMFLSHSYDHRVIDGALGGKFVRRVADYLENFELNKKIS